VIPCVAVVRIPPACDPAAVRLYRAVCRHMEVVDEFRAAACVPRGRGERELDYDVPDRPPRGWARP
jgi:hypothetical protein